MVPILLLAKIRTPTFYRTLSQHALPTSYNQAVFLLTDMVVNSRYIDTSTGSGTLLVIDEHRPLTHSDFSLCISAQTFKHLKTLLCWTSDCLPLVLKILKFFCVPSMSLKHPYFCNICQKRMWQSLAAVFYLTPSGLSAGSSLYSRQAGVSGFGATVWNDLPLPFASAPSLAIVRRLKIFLFSSAYQDPIMWLVCYYHHSWLFVHLWSLQ